MHMHTKIRHTAEYFKERAHTLMTDNPFIINLSYDYICDALHNYSRLSESSIAVLTKVKEDYYIGSGRIIPIEEAFVYPSLLVRELRHIYPDLHLNVNTLKVVFYPK